MSFHIISPRPLRIVPALAQALADQAVDARLAARSARPASPAAAAPAISSTSLRRMAIANSCQPSAPRSGRRPARRSRNPRSRHRDWRSRRSRGALIMIGRPLMVTPGDDRRRAPRSTGRPMIVGAVARDIDHPAQARIAVGLEPRRGDRRGAAGNRGAAIAAIGAAASSAAKARAAAAPSTIRPGDGGACVSSPAHST